MLQLTEHALLRWEQYVSWSEGLLEKIAGFLTHREGSKLERGRWAVSLEFEGREIAVLIIENGWVVTILLPGDRLGRRTKRLKPVVLR